MKSIKWVNMYSEHVDRSQGHERKDQLKAEHVKGSWNPPASANSVGERHALRQPRQPIEQILEHSTSVIASILFYVHAVLNDQRHSISYPSEDRRLPESRGP